jgi:hypothetical protein
MIVWPHVRQNASGGLLEKYGGEGEGDIFLENPEFISFGLEGYKITLFWANRNG